ncbi:hypothetical protein Sjap_016664 [Stephania japonica]|uniref:Uncharacterized protein n=1 Tax=Stephania japonica TaxID=461633 RepID=A0AAP0ILQ5_9MAGN
MFPFDVAFDATPSCHIYQSLVPPNIVCSGLLPHSFVALGKLDNGCVSSHLSPNLLKAARILANLIVVGSGVLARAFVQAYRQALTNASKSGVSQETIQNTVRRAGKTMTETEAKQILGVTEGSSWEEVLQKYDALFQRNAQNGSFYLQSKVHRAKECLEAAYGGKSGLPS